MLESFSHSLISLQWSPNCINLSFKIPFSSYWNSSTHTLWHFTVPPLPHTTSTWAFSPLLAKHLYSVLLITALVRGSGKYSNFVSVTNPDQQSGLAEQWGLQCCMLQPSTRSDLHIRIPHSYAYKVCNWKRQAAWSNIIFLKENRVSHCVAALARRP